MVFDAAATHAYLVNELSNTISVLNYDSSSGALSLAQTISTLPAGFSGNNTGADIRLHPGGRFLYATNRGDESIATFAVSPADGTLKLAGHTPVQVKMPRGFAIDPSGQFLLAAGQQSDSVALFAIAPESGNLLLKGFVGVPKPVCITFFQTSSADKTYNK
jgi:6-phosphogluconolactonase